MYYSYDNFTKDLFDLKQQIEAKSSKPDAIIAIARGGLTMAHFMAIAWEINKVYVLNASSYDKSNKAGKLKLFNIPLIPDADKKLLIVDEIVDSGESLLQVNEYFCKHYPDKSFESAVIFQKNDAVFKADFSLRQNDEWVDFFWEVWHKK